MDELSIRHRLIIGKRGRATRRQRVDATNPMASTAHTGDKIRRSLRRNGGDELPDTSTSVRPANPKDARNASTAAADLMITRRSRPRLGLAAMSARAPRPVATT